MNYFTFKPQFHPSLIAHIKRSTIRAKAKVKPGEVFACRYWTARPYGSPMGTLGTATCLAVYNIEIRPKLILMALMAHVEKALIPVDITYGFANQEQLAELEGFKDLNEMEEWFIAEHRIHRKPLRGVLTYWGDSFKEAKP